MFDGHVVPLKEKVVAAAAKPHRQQVALMEIEGQNSINLSTSHTQNLFRGEVQQTHNVRNCNKK